MNMIIANFVSRFNAVDHLLLFKDFNGTIRHLVKGYKELKEYAEDHPDFERDDQFRIDYCKFYMMSRYASPAYRDLYFTKMKDCFVHPELLSLPTLLRDLKNTFAKKPRIEMSFVSKLMNFVDDVHFPIYDKGIREAFGFVIPYGEDAKMAYYPVMYQAIIDAYNQLAHHPSISVFRTEFNCEELSSFRILDFIIITCIRNNRW